MSRSRASTDAGKRRASARDRPSVEAHGRRPRPQPPTSPAPKAHGAQARRPRSTTKPRRPPRREPAPEAPAPDSRSAPLAPARTARGAVRLAAACARERSAAARWRTASRSIAIVAATAAAGYFFWLRDSSLVAVDNVDVVGRHERRPRRRSSAS